jgi:ATP-binding cassette subfamily F protein 3
VLSGGERQRVALTRLLLSPANLLLLDEPTHHLDLAGKEVLEEALAQFPGALVVVTHDRSLMARVATRVLEVRDGRVTLYPGGYDDWEAARQARAVAEPEPAAVRPGAPAARPAAARAERAAEREAERRQRATEHRREREMRRVEQAIEEREGRLHAIESQLADPEVYADGARARALVGDYERLRAEVESLWQRLGEL